MKKYSFKENGIIYSFVVGEVGRKTLHNGNYAKEYGIYLVKEKINGVKQTSIEKFLNSEIVSMTWHKRSKAFKERSRIMEIYHSREKSEWHESFHLNFRYVT